MTLLNTIKSLTTYWGLAALLCVQGASMAQQTPKHPKQATSKPDYNNVFRQDKVVRIDIKIDPKSWQQMQAELSELLPPMPNKPAGQHGPMQGPPPEGHGQPMPQGLPRPPQGKKAPMEHKTSNPSWQACTVSFGGKVMQHVGIRSKGNSSLRAASTAKSKKFSFKLDFDKFKKQYPETKNRRLYGFNQLNLNNNYKDASLMREKVATDLFSEFGIASAKTAFCSLYIDKGDGPSFHGIYTLVEEVDDTVLSTCFGSDKGNLYKPENGAATFADGTFSKKDMNLKNNKKKAKYKDVKKLYETLHSSARLSKAQAWQEELERVFDVDVFLKWLAAKRVMENWDTYGRAPHNFYLYKNPTSKRLSWIPWDNNEALRSPKQPASLDFSETTANDHWPLISFLLKQPEYKQKYLNYVRVFSSELFSTTKMNRKYAQYKALLKPFIALEAKNGFSVSSEADFEQAIAYLYNHVQRRNQAVEAYFADAK